MQFYERAFKTALTHPGVHLIKDGWNDFGYYTSYRMYFLDEHGNKTEIGFVKIAMSIEDNESTAIPSKFTQLDTSYFSLGQGIDYFKNLNKLGPTIRDEILKGLNDIAYDLDLFEKVREFNITRKSLLRDYKVFTVKDQFHRVAKGGVPLTPYSFSYCHTYNDRESVEFDFEVVPDSMPPTNIHALIGSNGVGKTTIINDMIYSLLYDSKSQNADSYFYDNENFDSTNLFANTIFISFSAFDNTPHYRDKIDEEKGPLYSYIGLKDSELIEKNESNSVERYVTKTPETLIDEFIRSIKFIKETTDKRKFHKWEEAIEMLESDAIFKSFGLREVDLSRIEELKVIFNRLSSGHKIILLTITKLIEKVDEKSLVILDEPESHLHPPLLSSFIRALSDILISQNGVAIIATHSPVILQELPRSCVSIIKRSSKSCSVLRPEIETFGENVGTLTREVFGLEVTYSGFHKILEDLVEQGKGYDEIVEQFNGELGIEARTILRSLLMYKE
ncbi:ATP-binding cassette domain-containing protein [Brevibacillus brevis]|uniref:ATP-binding cassette domain-containing protein n=1 Tax=Brevibacillus brevis TaxID=1393 RepID=A0A2Z4MKJ4_BREBE|nr:AAA family ATPase [Brevibacillus brevis]AWX56929.1 ATP-binding cassette domain-containing protein [Brevibacillus brevis]